MKNINSTGSDNIVFIDCFVVLVFYMCILLSLSLLLIGEDDNDKAPELKNEFMITATWSTEDDSDIDLWGRKDLRNDAVCFFRRREVDVFTLHNDNTGAKYGVVANRRLPAAVETMTISTLQPGFYEFSLHGYRVPQHKSPCTVLVRVERLNPYQLI